jgi:thymidylate synthase
LKARVSSVRERQGFLDVLNWVNQNAPKEGDDLKGQDHVTAILEQLAREPRELPRMHIARKPFDQLAFEDFALENYEPHPVIKRAMAV